MNTTEQLEDSKEQTTRNGRSQLITLRVPLDVLPLIDQHATATGKTRTGLLLEGAQLVMQADAIER